MLKGGKWKFPKFPFFSNKILTKIKVFFIDTNDDVKFKVYLPNFFFTGENVKGGYTADLRKLGLVNSTNLIQYSNSLLAVSQSSRLSPDCGQCDVLQVVLGNLHLVSSVLVLLSYYSRRSWLMVLTGHLVSLLSVASIALGGLLTGKHGNVYVRNKKDRIFMALSPSYCLILTS